MKRACSGQQRGCQGRSQGCRAGSEMDLWRRPCVRSRFHAQRPEPGGCPWEASSPWTGAGDKDRRGGVRGHGPRAGPPVVCSSSVCRRLSLTAAPSVETPRAFTAQDVTLPERSSVLSSTCSSCIQRAWTLLSAEGCWRLATRNRKPKRQRAQEGGDCLAGRMAEVGGPRGVRGSSSEPVSASSLGKAAWQVWVHEGSRRGGHPLSPLKAVTAPWERMGQGR